MAATPEAKVKAKIKKILNDHGVYGNAGVPDFLCCAGGGFLAIEAKAGKGTTTALQEKNLREIREAGGIALVVNEDNLDLLETHLKLARNTA